MKTDPVFASYLANIKTKTGKTPADFKALAKKKGLLRPGVKAGEMKPPKLLPKFMTPPPVPASAPAVSIIAAQKGPSTDSTKAVANDRKRAAT